MDLYYYLQSYRVSRRALTSHLVSLMSEATKDGGVVSNIQIHKQETGVV